MDKRRYNGGNSTKAIHPEMDKRTFSKGDLETAYSALSPFVPEALNVIELALMEKQRWAVETVLKYVYSLPKTDITTTHQTPAFEFNIKDLFKPGGNGNIEIPTCEEDYFTIQKNQIK